MSGTRVLSLSISAFMILAFILSLSCNAYALGIAPSQKIMEYDTEEHMMTGRIINNDGRDMILSITASGELAEYVTILEPVITVQSYEVEKEFNYILTLPLGLDTPGTKTIWITAAETGGATDFGNGVGGLMAVTQQLQVLVPYVGEYCEGYVSIVPNEADDSVMFSLELRNKGTQAVNHASGILNITYDGMVVQSITLQDQGYLLPGDSKLFENTIRLMAPGAYTAEYYMDYDGKSVVLRKEFTLGDYGLSIKAAQVKNFKLGTAAKFDISVSNDWNVPIADVHGELTVKDRNGTIVGRFNTTDTSLDPRTGSLTAYWDTAGVAAGEYSISIALYAGNSNARVLDQTFDSIVSDNRILVLAEVSKSYDATLSSPKTRDLGSYGIWVYISLVVISIILVILVYLVILDRVKRN